MDTAEVLELQSENLQLEYRNTEAEANISRYTVNQLSYNDFYWNFMQRNWPVILTDVSNEWECRRNWTIHGDDDTIADSIDNRRKYNAINFDYLRRKVDNCRVPVADCSSKYFNSHAKTEMCFHEFLNYWQNQVKNESSTGDNSNKEVSIERPTENFYLKDWHLKSQLPQYDFYKVPKHFASDWLNELLIATDKDDYRFVYMGPKGSWTPFHSDVFGSYSWSTNVAGCKKWILLPPGEELKLADNLGNLPFCIDEEQLQNKQVQFFTIHQEENEAIFVPSGWFHQVWNLTDTISVNHNWFNACNVNNIWNNLSTNMRQVIAEIEDCRQMDNFDEHCQTMLRASFGINYLDFLDIIEFIALRRMACCNNGNEASVADMSSKYLFFELYILNEYHIRHDIRSIRTVLESMVQDTVVCDSRCILYRRCLRLLEQTKGF